MSLIVEDGSGLSTAESYASVSEADAYFVAHTNPTAWSALATPAKEQALRLAAQYLDVIYGVRWRGTRVRLDQSLAWPRYGVYDFDGFYVKSTTVPQALKDACSEMALRSLTDTLIPDIDTPGELKSQTIKVGPIETSETYAGSQSQVKRYRMVDKLLRNLIWSSDTVGRS